MYGAEGTNPAWERVDNGSDFIAARIVIKLRHYNLLSTRIVIKLFDYDLFTTRIVIKSFHMYFMSFRALVKSEWHFVAKILGGVAENV